MTVRLYENDMEARSCHATVTAVTAEGAVVLDQTVFYAQGGGQPGDVGTLNWEDGSASVINTIKGAGGQVLHLMEDALSPPPVGSSVVASLNWERRYKLMRMHTGLHLLCSVVNAPVTGGSIGADKGRLDFDLDQSPDKAQIQAALDAAIAADYPVTIGSISDAELDANPELVRTMSVQPPRGSGTIRMVRIGFANVGPFDYQPCGGTHVTTTGQVGRLVLGKIEKKGKQNRRIGVVWEE